MSYQQQVSLPVELTDTLTIHNEELSLKIAFTSNILVHTSVIKFGLCLYMLVSHVVSPYLFLDYFLN